MTGPHAKTMRRVERIRVLRARGLEQWRIAKEVGCSQPEVCRLIGTYIDHRISVGPLQSAGSPEEIYDRWMTVHDIRSMGERAVRETA